MGRFKKTRAQVNRERLEKQEQAAALRRAQTKFEHLTKVNLTVIEPKEYVPPVAWRPEAKVYPSLNNGVDPVRVLSKVEYTGELAKREEEARKEVEAKKKRVAPLFNKGGYQYITDGTDLKDIGRKNPT